MNQVRIESKDQQALLNLSIDYANSMLSNAALISNLDFDEKKLVAKAISLAKQQMIQASAMALNETDYQELAQLVKEAVSQK